MVKDGMMKIRGIKMGREKFVSIILVGLMLLILISTSPMVHAGKAYYWLVTDGYIFPESVITEYADQWTENGSNERVAEFQWFVDKGTSRGGSSVGSNKPVGGTKATLSMTGPGNDLHLNIQIYKGGAKSPSAGPEIYNWTIIDGKNSTFDCINIVFTDLITGKSIKSVSLYENDVVNIGIPHVLIFECRMWLI
jgi:hypothetical protein